VKPEIDIWRAATLMLKRYGDKALEQSITRADELAADRRSRRRGHLAPDHRRRRAARQHHAAWTAALIGTHPKRPSRFVPVYS
jgi:hypothetical protein